MPRLVAIFAGLGLLAALSGCGGVRDQATGGEVRSNAGPQSEEVLRSKVVTGVGEDFRGGTHAGPKGYGICIRAAIGRALDRATLRRLLDVSRRPHGAALAAQALNAITVPIGDACGGRRFVPELVHAAAALRGARLVDSPAHRIGLEYGPYLGISCPRPGRRACDRIGIDLVLRRQARSVTAIVAGRRVQLVTPGPVPHDAGAVGRDWGGFLANAGVRRGGSPTRLSIRIAVVYPGGRREALRMPPARVRPGFG